MSLRKMKVGEAVTLVEEHLAPLKRLEAADPDAIVEAGGEIDAYTDVNSGAGRVRLSVAIHAQIGPNAPINVTARPKEGR